MGPSGSGKSTLLQLAAGLDRPDPGSRAPRRRRARTARRASAGPAAARADRLRVPVVQPARRADRGAERRPAVAAGRPAAPARRGPRGARARSGSTTRRATGPRSCRAASSSASRSRARSSARPSVVFADEPTGALDRAPAATSSRCCASTVDERRPHAGDGHPRPVAPPPRPTASCSWPTAASPASCRADGRAGRRAHDRTGGLTCCASRCRRCAPAAARSPAPSSPSGSRSRSPTPPDC